MVRLRRIEALQRKCRQDDVNELGIQSWDFVRQLIQAGNTEEALEIIDYELTLAKAMTDRLVSHLEITMTNLASLNEEAVEQNYRERYTPIVKKMLATTPGVEESLYTWAELFRGLYGNIEITEEPDRYVIKQNPCGSGLNLRRMRSVGTTKKAYPWSWGKKGVSYYCAHCCMTLEILPIEMRGYPICLIEYPENPEDPCVTLFYKKPELIPDEYFIRVGKTPWRLKQD